MACLIINIFTILHNIKHITSIYFVEKTTITNVFYKLMLIPFKLCCFKLYKTQINNMRVG
jgi:hypothetical protein